METLATSCCSVVPFVILGAGEPKWSFSPSLRLRGERKKERFGVSRVFDFTRNAD